MFLNKYVSDFYIDLIYDNYDINYINSLDEKNFRLIYLLFVKYQFDFIEDIVLKYLEIFEMNFYDVYNKLEELSKKYGNNFVDIISNDMTILNYIVE